MIEERDIASSPYNGAAFTNATTRVTWIVPFIIWILWALSLLARYVVGPHRDDVAEGDVEGTGTSRVATDAPATVGNKRGRLGFGGSLARRAQRCVDVYRDGLIMITVALVANTFGSGTTRGTETLSWIFLAFLVVWAFAEAGVDHRFARLFFGVIEFGIILAIFILSWAAGYFW